MPVKAEQFPFPFTEDRYAYSNNSSLLKPARSVTMTDRYLEEIQLKRELLQANHQRCFRSLPLSLESQWEAMKRIFTELARNEPDYFSFEKRGNEYRFQNHLLEEEERLIYRDLSSIERQPLDIAGRHVQEDLIIMGDRHDGLFLEAGQLCFPSNWSLTFVLGMDFKSIHTPVPGITHKDFIGKVERFISRIRQNEAWERKNWSMTISNKLDTPLETYANWGKLRLQVTDENVGELVHLRVEVQRLLRLPITNDVLFTIHTYLLPLNDLIRNDLWLKRLYTTIQFLSDEIAEYKGIALYKNELMQFLEKTLSEKGISL